MTYIPGQQQNTGSYIPTTAVFDISQIYETNVNSPEFKQLIVKLSESINNIALVLNNKISGYYLNEEFASGKSFFNPNSSNPLDLIPAFIKVIPFNTINAGMNTQAHGLSITNTWKFISAYGMASDSAGFNYYPLGFSSVGGATNIELRVDATNVIINNNSGIVFTSALVILEYLKY